MRSNNLNSRIIILNKLTIRISYKLINPMKRKGFNPSTPLVGIFIVKDLDVTHHRQSFILNAQYVIKA